MTSICEIVFCRRDISKQSRQSRRSTFWRLKMENVVTVNVQLQLTRKGIPFKDEADMLSWIAACLNCNTNHVEANISMAETPTVIVNMDGGRIQNMSSSQPLRMIVLDADTEGTTDDLSNIDGEEVIVVDHNPVDIDPNYVLTIVGQVESAGK